MSPDHNPVPFKHRRTLRTVGIAGATIFAFVVVTGIASRETSNARLRELTEKQAIPTVAAVLPDPRGRVTTLDLPGRLEAYYRAQIYARSSGYLKDWKVDIGARVKAGDLLAEIEAPDLDQQFLQAQADLASAVANMKLSEANLKRGESLVHSSWISQQDFDQRTADLGNKQGLVKAAQANVDRLQVLEEYKRIIAPFDGLVTARNTDIGALISAGGSGPPLFVVSDIHKLRVYVNVPQNSVPDVRIGTQAKIAVPEYPGRTFPAVVEASAQAVDVASGTTRMQLGVDNTNGELMPGAFANVRLELPSSVASLNVPASALIFDQAGLRIATIGSGDRVVFKKVTIARDLGKEVEIASGLNADDRVIENLPDGVVEGDAVRIANSRELTGGPQPQSGSDSAKAASGG
jgi:RND family efflux transporter MFP subunit